MPGPSSLSLALRFFRRETGKWVRPGGNANPGVGTPAPPCDTCPLSSTFSGYFPTCRMGILTPILQEVAQNQFGGWGVGEASMMR